MNHGKAEAGWAIVLLVAVTVAPFAQVWGHGFVNYDDNLYITENLRVQGGLSWEGVRWAFTSTGFSNWFPLTWLSFMLDYELYGLNASGYHLTNLVLHLLNVVLLFWVLQRMTGGLWQSALVAALFGVHPLHVESVAWVAERKDVLSTLFGFLALLAYLRWVERPGRTRHLLVLLALAASLMAKPMFVTFPFVLLLLDYWPLERLALGDAKALGRLVLEKAPLFALVAASAAVTLVVQSTGGAVQELEVLPLATRLGNAVVAYASYLGMMFWPDDLAVLYPYRAQGLEPWKLVGSAVLLLGISGWVVRAARRRPYLPVGWLWYLGTLVPVIGIVQVGIQSMADRYTYVPLVGPFLMLSWGAFEATAGWRHGRVALAGAAAAVLSIAMVLTGIQVGRWRDSVTLFEHTLRVTSDNYMVENNLGFSLSQLGRPREAIPHFERALAIEPEFADAHDNLGLALDEVGRTADAIAHFERSLAIRPGDSRVHNSLGIALGKLGRMSEANAHFSQALLIDPDFADAHNNLGIALANQGRYREAIVHFRRALELDPGAAGIEANLRLAIEVQDRKEDAVGD